MFKQMGNIVKTVLILLCLLSVQCGISFAASYGDDVLGQVQEELNRKGLKGKVLATTIGHNNNGYLSLMINSFGKYEIVVNDLKNERIGMAGASRELLYFTEKRPKAGSKAIITFKLIILNDTTDRDSKSGAWYQGNHYLPVYAFYEFDNTGNLIPGMLYTGGGATPSHYHNYFYEQHNVDTINLLLTEMMTLQRDIDARRVNLPY